MRWERHVVWQKRRTCRVLVGRPDVNERIILKWIFKKWGKGGKD
jgi:hypothetical protein